MAPKVGLLVLLWWNLTLAVHGVESLCNLTCSTDYKASLNCSCSASVPTYSVLVRVSCSDGELEVNGTCEVKPPRSWCVMSPDDLELVASIGTQCNATAIPGGDGATVASAESSTWQLSEVVKPPPPSDIQVTITEGTYNITWDHGNTMDCLMYRLRMRPTEDASKEPYYFQVMEEKRFLLEQRVLKPHVHYTVDIQAKMCPGNLYEGPWSEWSSAESRLPGTYETEGFKWHLFFVPPSIILLIILALIFLVTKLWKNKIPDPNEFFKPLYGTYGGNFKEWVKPVFSEYDFLRISSQVQPKSDRQQDVAQWKSEKQSFRESEEMTGNGHLFQMLEPSDNSLLYFLEGSTRSEGTGHSAGHISIHTVTLSGEEELGEAAVSESSPSALRGYQDGENFDVFAGDDQEQAAFDFEEPQVVGFHRHSGVSVPHRENQAPLRRDSSAENLNFPPHVQFIEPERVSLDSFVFNERSDDGYPHVDLDTVDSGFGECGSPGASDSNESEQTDSLHEYKSSNSNYVKQWVVCRTVEEG